VGRFARKKGGLVARFDVAKYVLRSDCGRGE
jgi:hypothetical protein